MAERNLRIRLGAFVAVALAGLTGLVFLFARSPAGLFTTRPKYTVVFAEAPGVAAGTPVRKSGVRVGEVQKIDLDDETGLVRVHLLMDPGYQPRRSEDATITRGLLSGDTSLDFVPKVNPDGTAVPKDEPYPPDSTIPGIAPINPRTLLTQASGAIPNAQESVQRIMMTFQRIELAVPKAERALDEIAALARSVREAVPELRQTNLKVQDLIGSADPPPPPLRNVPGIEKVIAQAAAPGDPAADPLVQPTLRTTLRDITELLRAIRPAAEDIRDLVRDSGPEVAGTARSVRRAADSANDLLNPENRKNAAAILRNLQAGSDDLTKAIRLAAILLDGADKVVRELNARLAQSEQVLTNIDRVTKPFADNAGTLAADVGTALKSVNVAAGELARVLTDVRGIVQQAARSEGTVAKLVADPTLFNNLDAAAANAARLLARAEQITKDLQVFADKIARRPELIGVGGAVKGSSGLKEAPTEPLPPSPLGPVPPAPVSPRPVRSDAEGVLAPIPPVSREGIGPVTVPVPAFRPADLPPPEPR